MTGVNEYRYVLRRRSGRLKASGEALFVMLNPSTADEVHDDPTIRRLKGFAFRYELTGFTVVNLFAARATDPEELLTFSDACGPRNDLTIREELGKATLIVAAWGAPRVGPRGILGAKTIVRIVQVLGLYGEGSIEWFCFGTTADGSPRHPLYVKSDTELVRWFPDKWRESHNATWGHRLAEHRRLQGDGAEGAPR